MFNPIQTPIMDSILLVRLIAFDQNTPLLAMSVVLIWNALHRYNELSVLEISNWHHKAEDHLFSPKHMMYGFATAFGGLEDKRKSSSYGFALIHVMTLLFVQVLQSI